MSRLKTYLSKLKDKYRLVIINDSSFEEKFAFRLSRWNVIMIFSTFTVLLATLVVLFIVFTPLKAMIPGYSDAETRKNSRIALESSRKIEKQLQLNEAYIFNLKRVLNGELDADSVTVMPEKIDGYTNLDYSISSADSLLRQEIAEKDKYNLIEGSGKSSSNRGDISNLNFFCPLKGNISSTYDLGVNHLGIDIVAPENETIKSILNGVVILANWSAEEGYVITVQHPHDVISIYKHNSVLLKSAGDIVEVGESIAVIGNSGELTDGPHLHFEIWHKGIALNPEDYILFN